MMIGYVPKVQGYRRWTNRGGLGLRYVYVLRARRGGRAYYVGQTADPTERLWGHVSDARCAVKRGNPSAKQAWVRRNERTIVMQIVARVPWSRVKDVERRWICKLSRNGEPLFNVTHNRRAAGGAR